MLSYNHHLISAASAVTIKLRRSLNFHYTKSKLTVYIETVAMSFFSHVFRFFGLFRGEGLLIRFDYTRGVDESS